MKKEITINGIMKLVQFTKPQAAIIDKLQNGSKATYINTHRRDGGDFVWFEKDGNYWGAECVGYRAFNGAMSAIRKAFNLTAEQENALYANYIIE